jgi:hypothetical protein
MPQTRDERGCETQPTEVQMAELPPPEGIVLAHFIVSDDVERSRRFYTEVLGGKVAFSGPGGLTYVALANTWITSTSGSKTSPASTPNGTPAALTS